MLTVRSQPSAFNVLRRLDLTAVVVALYRIITGGVRAMLALKAG